MKEFKRWILEAKQNLQVSCLFLWTGRLCLLWVRVQHEGGSYPKRAGDQCVQLGTAVPWWGAPCSSWGHPPPPPLLWAGDGSKKKYWSVLLCLIRGLVCFGFFSKIHVQNLKQLKWGDCSDVGKCTHWVATLSRRHLRVLPGACGNPAWPRPPLHLGREWAEPAAEQASCLPTARVGNPINEGSPRWISLIWWGVWFCSPFFWVGSGVETEWSPCERRCPFSPAVGCCSVVEAGAA